MTYLSGRGTCIWAPRSGAMGCGCQPMILLQVCSCGNLRCTDGNRRSGAQSLVWCRRPGGHRCIDCVFTRFTVARSGRAALIRQRFQFAQGEVRQMDVGQTWIRVGGREVITLVLFNDEGTHPLLGALALEALFMGVDPAARKLVPVEGLMM